MHVRICYLDEDEHGAEPRRHLPHEPGVVGEELDVALVAGVQEDGRRLAAPERVVHEVPLLERAVARWRHVEVVQPLRVLLRLVLHRRRHGGPGAACGRHLPCRQRRGEMPRQRRWWPPVAAGGCMAREEDEEDGGRDHSLQG
jgi:hypothetical protein